MSGFSRPDFVEEFAYRTKSNYYSLMIEQAKQQNNKEVVEQYESKLLDLKFDMYQGKYSSEENYYEVTQLINSLIGLLVFPEQMYFEQAKKLDREKSLKTLNEIITDKESGKFTCTYKQIDRKIKISLSPEEQNKLTNNSERQNLIKKYFAAIEPEKETPDVILRHMRNAIAHENICIHPIKQWGKITSVVFEDYGIAKIMPERKGCHGYHLEYGTFRKDMIRRNKDGSICPGPNDGYFKLEIDVDKLEPVLMEICDAVLKIAREG